jgi:hypothetical protein
MDFIEKSYKELSDQGLIGLDSMSRIVELIDNKYISPNLINNIFEYYMNNENLLVIKEYSKYFNNKELIKWICNIVKINRDDIILDGNVKINSFIDYLIQNNIPKEKLYGIQTNDIIRKLSLKNLSFNTNKDFSDNISNTDIIFNDVPFNNKTFDVIFLDFPSGIHNIIHANCCQKIKKLKIRGTKSEPLLLQFVMMSLNKNGRAALIVPDSLLFSDSLQPIQTRKYLVENYNLKKIVELDESKSSLLYFENNGTTQDILFSKLVGGMETNIMKLNSKTLNSNYSLYHKHYSDIIKPKNNELKYDSLENFLEISFEIPTKKLYIVLDKYYKNSESIQFNKEGYIYMTNKSDNDFYIHYIYHILGSEYEKFTKGKMLQFDIDKLTKYMVPVLDMETQKSICNYLMVSNNIINNNNQYIENNNKMKDYLINSIPKRETVELQNISELYNGPSLNKKLIGIIRNGLMAGTVYILNENEQLSNNSHYILITDEQYNLDYVYYMMKHSERDLQDLANLTSQPNLNKSNLMSYKILSIKKPSQMEIVSYCKDFDTNIEKYNMINKNIREKNIIDIILKLNNM